jgi:hypothetical protein
MFQRKVTVTYTAAAAAAETAATPCPIKWLDNFAMRNFTNDAVFDDTLPVGDGLLEIGNRVPLDRLSTSMQDWFRRKGYLKTGDGLHILELSAPAL